MKQGIAIKPGFEYSGMLGLTRMVLYSIVFHLVLLAIAFLSPFLSGGPKHIQTVYSVDLVELSPSNPGLQSSNSGEKSVNPETVKTGKSSVAEQIPKAENIKIDNRSEQLANIAESKKENVAAAPPPKTPEPQKALTKNKTQSPTTKSPGKSNDKVLIPAKNTEPKENNTSSKAETKEVKRNDKNRQSQEKATAKSEIAKTAGKGPDTQSVKNSSQSSELSGKNLTGHNLAALNKRDSVLSGMPGESEFGKPGSGPTGQGLIASDNPSFQNITYLDAIASKMYQNWNFNLWRIDITQFQHLEVMINIIINKDGTIQNPTIQKSSGIPFLDRSALSAVYNSNPLPPLPKEFKDQYLNINLKFIPIPQEG